MPGNKEIAEWLREAGHRIHALERGADVNQDRVMYGHNIRSYHEKANLVEQMRCGTCHWWEHSAELSCSFYGNCMEPGHMDPDSSNTTHTGPQFCCCHWDRKE
jgi:hypothetical protein